MIIDSASQSLSGGRLQIGNRRLGGLDSLGSSLSIASGNQLESQPASVQKNSLYANFEKEISRRLTERAKRSGSDENEAPGPSVLAKSLTGAMGEIEKIFGREAATEVMAKIISGTADGLTEDSLLSSIQNSLAGLSRLDHNGTKIRRLAEDFNRDLGLALEPELAEKKLENKETLSLSYALSSHFGSLASPEAGKYPVDSAEADDDGLTVSQRPGTGESWEMLGFDESGRWNLVRVEQLDQVSRDELEEAAEAGVERAVGLTLADIMEKDKSGKLFYDLANFLKNDLRDKQAAAFVEQCVFDSESLIYDQYGSSPKLSEMLSQAYAKVAADGEADKLALFEDYINSDFKGAINAVLAELRLAGEDEDLLAEAGLGGLQFKGLNGASLAGENDVFSLNWGYENDSSYDRVLTRRFLQEDIRGVKAVKEKQDGIVQSIFIENWDDSAEEIRLAEMKMARDRPKSKGLPGLGRNEEESAKAEDEKLSTTFGEKYGEEKRRNKLDEALSVKFGQLSDEAQDELEKFIQDNFEEEEAEKLLEHTRWSNDLMSGLAGMHRDIRESGGSENKAREFMNFINSQTKKEVDKIAAELGEGLSFDGWRALEGPEGEIQAVFKFAGRDQATTVTIAGPERTILEEADAVAGNLTADQILNSARSSKEAGQAQPTQVSSRFSSKPGSGCLVNLLA